MGIRWIQSEGLEILIFLVRALELVEQPCNLDQLFSWEVGNSFTVIADHKEDLTLKLSPALQIDCQPLFRVYCEYLEGKQTAPELHVYEAHVALRHDVQDKRRSSNSC